MSELLRQVLASLQRDKANYFIDREYGGFLGSGDASKNYDQIHNILQQTQYTDPDENLLKALLGDDEFYRRSAAQQNLEEQLNLGVPIDDLWKLR